MNKNFADKSALTALLLSAGVNQAVIDMNDGTGNIANLLSRGQRDDFFASRFSTVAETAKSNAQETLRIQMLVMSGGDHKSEKK